MTNARLFYVLCFCVLFPSCSKKEDTAKINMAFNNYVKFAKEHDYGNLAETVSDKTLRYFAQCIDFARYSSKDEVTHLPYVDKILVYYIRVAIPEERIYSLDAKSFLKYSNELKLINLDSLQKMMLKDIKIDKNTASANIYDSLGRYSCPLGFEKKGNAWKVNLLPTINMINSFLHSHEDKSVNNDISIIRDIAKELNVSIDTNTILNPMVN